MTMNNFLTGAGRIYLVGMRGSGKSTVGRILARHLGWNFADADDEIEVRVGCSISDLLKTAGLGVLRDREAEVVRAMVLFERYVIATAGGCVIRPENRDLLRATGRIIWLTGKPETLRSRIQLDPQSAARRPPLTDLDPLAEIAHLAEQRDPWYREVAELVISTEDRTPDQVAATILSSWPSS
jgi:shikimate kinase